jgi:hypothetical protein
MALAAELCDHAMDDLADLHGRARRRVIDRHVQNDTSGKAGSSDSGDGKRPRHPVGMNRAVAEDRQSEAGADRGLRARHAFYFAHNVDFLLDDQSLPLQ